METLSLSTCLSKLITDGKPVRKAFSNRAQRYGLRQFPCHVHGDGSISVDTGYLNGVRGAGAKTAATLSTEPWDWEDKTTLPSKENLVRALGITKSDRVIKNSSHGEIWFGTVQCARNDTATSAPTTTEVAIKFMPIQTREKDTHMSSRVANSAYVDPFISWLGSQLVTRGQSTAFAQLYGTFLCTGTVRSSSSAKEADAPAGERSPPLVAMISELLGKKIDVAVEECLPEKGRIHWKRLIAIVLQVMVALSQAHAMTFVHNDAHMGNFLVATQCHHAPMYVNVNGRHLMIPMQDRVVLMDFGRSTIAALDCESTTQCSSRRARETGPVARGGGNGPGCTTARLHASEVADKFAEWQLDNPGADVSHFAAMLVLCQTRKNMLVKQAMRKDAPPEAMALVRLLQRALQCDGGSDMFVKYAECNAEELKGLTESVSKKARCGKDLIHDLREKKTSCRGILPIDFLSDRELTASFVVTPETIPSSENIYLPIPSCVGEKARP